MGLQGEGLVARGTHRLFLGSIEESWPIVRRTAQQLVYRPVVAFAPPAFMNRLKRGKVFCSVFFRYGDLNSLFPSHASQAAHGIGVHHLGYTMYCRGAALHTAVGHTSLAVLIHIVKKMRYP